MGLPAVTAAERVTARQSALRQQRVCNRRRRRANQAHGFLVEQRRALPLDQRGVQVGVGKRLAAHHIVQKLHIGRQPDDADLRQRVVQPGQRFFPQLSLELLPLM